MRNPLISIIIPVFNRYSIIKLTLDSILAQTYTNWECIVVDDGSTDQTEQTVYGYSQKDSRIQFYQRPRDVKKGANSCRNYGFEISKGQYINWFDSDDVMKPNFIETKVRAFIDNVDAIIHRNNYANYSLTKFRDAKYEYKNGKSLFYNYAMENIEIQTCGFMWKRSFLEGKRLFDEDVSRYQDNEFHIRMLAIRTINIILLNNILATIRSGDGHRSQISSKSNLTKKKLFDVFYYRYQCLKLAEEKHIDTNENFNRTISKKALWSLYPTLKYEKSFWKRIVDLKTYSSKINFIYKNPQINFKDELKSKLYILKIILLR